MLHNGFINQRRCAINRHASLKLSILPGIMILAMVLTGCGLGGATPTPTSRPTAIVYTATPRSTPLPEVAQAAPVGDSTRPISILFVLPQNRRDDDVTRAQNALEDHLNSELGLAFEVSFLNNDTEALTELCSGRPAAVWASAFTLIAAERACGAKPGLAEVHGEGRSATVGETAEILIRMDFTNISALAGRVFCRVDEDFTSDDYLIHWVYPGLVMAAGGVNPTTDLRAVRTFPDEAALVRAIYEGHCTAAAITPGQFQDLVDEVEDELEVRDVRDIVKQLLRAEDTRLPADTADWDGYPEGVIPYDGLIFPSDQTISPTVRAQIINSIADFAESRNGRGLLEDILDADAVLRVGGDSETDYYAAFRALLTQARWDMAHSE